MCLMQRPALDFPYHCETGCSLGRIVWSGYYARSPGQAMGTLEGISIVYVVRGRCDYEDESGTRRRLAPGDIIIRVPGYRQGYRAPAGEAWDEQYIHADGPLMDMWVQDGLVDKADLLWRLLPVDYWLHRMVDVIGDVVAPGPDESLAQLGRLQVLLADMRIARRSAGAYPEDQLWLTQARKLLEASEANSRPDLRVAANMMGHGYHTFRRRFTRLSGIGPAHYRLQSQINLACLLIVRRPEMGNKELAIRCGFADEYHFSKQFKSVTGIPPATYRLQCADGHHRAKG